MRRPRALRGFRDCYSGVRREEQRYWREAHERTVPSGTFLSASRGLPCALESPERQAYGSAYVETFAVAAVMSLAHPPHVPRELIDRIEALALEEALRETERHGRIIGPLPWSEVERAAADHVVDGREAAWRREFERGIDVLSRYRGALLGLAAGDALGTIVLPTAAK
jgi:hypothetical protein